MTTPKRKTKTGRKLVDIDQAAMRGLLNCAGVIERLAVMRAPADTGNLRRSAEIYVGTNMQDASKCLDTIPIPENAHSVRITFTAEYAKAVHDASGRGKGKPRPNGRGRYWDPQATARPKFLESAVHDFAPQVGHFVMDAIKHEAKRKER